MSAFERRQKKLMEQEIWNKVDAYFSERFTPGDGSYDSVLRNSREKGLPPHHVSACQGLMLQILVKVSAARRILEIGTLGGYSTLWMAHALGEDGLIVTVESNAHHAAVAADNFIKEKMDHRIALLQGDAAKVMQSLIDQQTPAFDLVFIDADKPNNPIYLRLALQLSKNGTLIVGDNVVRNGALADPDSMDEKVKGVRKFCDDLAGNHTLLSTGIQTVGGKGYDGFTLTFVEK
jgi:predicted O-methyltransferase YrrM